MTDPATPDPDGLTARQAALVDSMTTRLWSGTPLNSYDYLAFVDIATILELPIRSAQRAEERRTET